MSGEDDTYSTIFTALKHPIRRRILRRLQTSSATYTELLNELSIENGLLNYHLESIKELLTKMEDGRYTLNEFGRAGFQLLQRIEEPMTESVKSNLGLVRPMRARNRIRPSSNTSSLMDNLILESISRLRVRINLKCFPVLRI